MDGLPLPAGNRTQGASRAAARPAWTRRLWTAVAVAAGLVAIYAAVGFLAVPSIARSQIETLALTQLGRRATVGEVRFNPFTLRARLSDFALADRDPGRTLLRFDTLDLDLSAACLWKLAPVVDAVRLVRPRLEIARGADGRYGIQDLVDRASAPSTGPDPVFAISNIEIEEGSVVLDDAVHRKKVAVSRLAIGIPFLSSFARDAQIRVKPHLRGVVDGAPFALAGTSTSPFEDMQVATLDFNLDALPLPRYMDYATLPNGLRLTDGALTTRLSLAFRVWKGTPRGITLTGKVLVDRLAIARKDGSPLVAVRAATVTLRALDFLGRSLSLDRIAVSGPEMDLRRLADGTLEIRQLLSPAPEAGPARAAAQAAGTDAPAPSGSPPSSWAWSVAEASISDGALRIVDQATAPPFQARLSAVTLTGADLASRGAAGTVEVAFATEEGARFVANGVIDVAGRAARGHVGVTKLPLSKLHPYYAGVLAIDVRRGVLDFEADFDAGALPAARFTLARGSTAIADLEAAIPGEREPLWRMASVNAEGVALDVAGRALTIDRIESRRGNLRLLRDADGTMHYERVLRAGPGPGRARGDGSAADGEAWRIVVRRLLVERLGVEFEDQVPDPPVRLHFSDARLAAENLDTAQGARASVDVAAQVGAKGRIRLHGLVAARPPMADCRLEAKDVDLVALRPYVESRTNVIVTGGTAAAKGRVTYTEAATSGTQARYVGDVAVTDFGSLDRPASEELVRWKSLTLTGVDATTAPFGLAMDAVALDQFYVRLVLHADATLNVRQLLAPRSAAPALSTAPAPDAKGAPPPAADAARRELPVSIGRIQLSRGEVEYSDFFVKPNYSAHLLDVNGGISALAPTQAGTIDLTARVGGSAPVDIRGTLNPFARDLALDLTGKASDVDLPPLTPYSVKYAGYGIQKGQLSMEVRYKVDNRKLAATNKLVLDQLTFGERVESPTATRLPVLLAVALLKDRHGVIKLDLPIEGTLDDPKFSIWRVVVQMIVNLLAKVATAPFALLGAIVGGGGEQLAYVEFAPGRADLSPAAQARLETLAKALADRPGLKLEAAGRAIPGVDGEGLKRASLDHALRIEKQKELAAGGASAPALEQLAIDAADYAKYLKAVYRKADLPDKPRNFIGMAKDVPAAQMEALLLASYRVDEEALRELANHRAQAVKEWFATRGSIPVERVFIVAARLHAEGITGGGAPTRVDFSIR